jgi:hypothetical protein
MKTVTKYFWKEITEDGRFIDADWANPEGYEHSDAATVHMHMRFSIDPCAADHLGAPKWHLMKFYGIADNKVDTP